MKSLMLIVSVAIRTISLFLMEISNGKYVAIQSFAKLLELFSTIFRRGVPNKLRCLFKHFAFHQFAILLHLDTIRAHLLLMIHLYNVITAIICEKCICNYRNNTFYIHFYFLLPRFR